MNLGLDFFGGGGRSGSSFWYRSLFPEFKSGLTPRMSSTTKGFVEDKSSEEVGPVHFLPFKVEYEGGARVTALFTRTATEHPHLQNVSCNYFRGRPLQGRKLELPKDFVAFVGEDSGGSGRGSGGGGGKILKEHDKEEGGGGDVVKIGKRFQHLIYWEWDKPPSSMDGLLKLQDWLSLSTVIHAPIEVTNG